MIDARTRGALLGVANGVTIALLYALDRPGDLFMFLGPPWFVEQVPTVAQLFLAVAMHTVPVGILWGILLGDSARDMSGGWPWRAVRLTMRSCVLTVISAVPWPGVATYGCVTATAYSTLLAWWVTRSEDPWPDQDVNLDELA